MTPDLLTRLTWAIAGALVGWTAGMLTLILAQDRPWRRRG